ncbi:MAG: hypothetical protein FWG65_07380 [Turicibacter sp.]|nr:hypothetical protein [Turicibacter sp.]
MTKKTMIRVPMFFLVLAAILVGVFSPLNVSAIPDIERYVVDLTVDEAVAAVVYAMDNEVWDDTVFFRPEELGDLHIPALDWRLRIVGDITAGDDIYAVVLDDVKVFIPDDVSDSVD